jgi:hypothetical protein
MAGQKRVSQETFDDAVRENMDDFGMSREDAINDAIEQFKMQVMKRCHPIEPPLSSCFALAGIGPRFDGVFLGRASTLATL